MKADWLSWGRIREFFKGRPAGVRYLLFVCTVLVYNAVAGRFGMESRGTQVLTEIPLLLYLYAWLQAPLRPARWSGVVAAVLPVLLYVIHDYYFILLGAVPDLVDLLLLPDLFHVMAAWQIVFGILILLVPVAGWFYLVDWKFEKWRRSLLLSAPLLALVGAVVLFPSGTCWFTSRVTPQLTWSARKNVYRWGRLYMAFAREARRRDHVGKLRDHPTLEESGLALDDGFLSGLDPRNVHIVVLESFIDVRLFEKLECSRVPLDPSFLELSGGRIGSSLAPCFGGGTSRSEFEILCGVPSLRLYGHEFLMFSGAPTYCLPNILSAAGYTTMLSFPHRPDFYNALKAYKGIGFTRTLFGDRYVMSDREIIKLGNDVHLFDGDLFRQNLKHVRRLLREERPFLNYVLTMYGHYPFPLNVKRHPLTVGVKPDEELLARIVNQTYHRSRALAEYLRALKEIDPGGIIVVVADHLPPLPQGVKDYELSSLRSLWVDTRSSLRRGILPVEIVRFWKAAAGEEKIPARLPGSSGPGLELKR
jgi:phosphoglycerol transferase MdoB-like AlkP superfamily enzyme